MSDTIRALQAEAEAILADATAANEAYALRRCRHCGATIAVRDGQRLEPITGAAHVCRPTTEEDTPHAHE